MATYDLGLSWDIVVDDDYVLNDTEGSIKDVCARVPTIWSINRCELC